jgi:hypothetical protein
LQLAPVHPLHADVSDETVGGVKISGLQCFFARTIELGHEAGRVQQISERLAYARIIVYNDDYTFIRLSTQILCSGTQSNGTE